MTTYIHWLWLTTRNGVSPQLATRLARDVGTPAFLYAANRAQLEQLEMLDNQLIDTLCDKNIKMAQEILQFCSEKSITLITVEDAGYPEYLRALDDAPAVLYVKGRLPNFDRNPPIAIVGTRSATPYGVAATEHFAASLVRAGFTIVTGSARGVDTAAIQAALRAGGNVVSVQAGGVDVPYPRENRYLLGDIAMTGAVISENPPGTQNDAFRFPIRNRILSGMSSAVLVTEAPVRSGALITARLAVEQGREVFAVPSNIDAPNQGCNTLIRENGAMLVTNAKQIVEILTAQLPQIQDVPQKQPACQPPMHRKQQVVQQKQEVVKQTIVIPPIKMQNLDEDAKMLVEFITQGVQTPDLMCQKCGWSPSQMMSRLTIMEIEGIVENKQGVFYLK